MSDLLDEMPEEKPTVKEKLKKQYPETTESLEIAPTVVEPMEFSEKALAIQDASMRQDVMAAPTPAQLLAQAVDKNLDTDKLEKLMELQERWEDRQAEKAFNEAMKKFQRLCPSIKRTKAVSFGGAGAAYNYAPLPDIIEQTREHLDECGLTYRFEIESTSESISVSCIITHIDGHSAKTTMSAPSDASGKKNAIQALGSTVTYLQRYTFIGALGITTADEDMDGRLADAGEVITEQQVEDLRILIQQAGSSEDKFCKHFKIDGKGIHFLPDTLYSRAVKMLQAKIRKDKEAKDGENK